MPSTSSPDSLPGPAQPGPAASRDSPSDVASSGTTPPQAPPSRRAPRHATGPATIDLDQVVHYLPRTGIGTDVHAFAAPGSTTVLHLACLEWPGQTGLEGHSDGDVVAHACCDALLSATGLGDLGSVFGTAEPRWQGASGAVLLAETARRVRQAGFEIGNIAVQLIGQRPRVADRTSQAAAALSAAASARVTFSATTTDHLGFLGREEGLAAVATALVYPTRPAP